MRLFFGQRDTQVFANRLSEADVDMRQLVNDPFADIRARDFTQLKAEGIDDMQLFNRRLARPEEPRMGVVFAK